MQRTASPLACLLLVSSVVAQTPGTGNTVSNEFDLLSQVTSGAFSAVDKMITLGAGIARFRIASHASHAGTPFALATGFAPAQSDPVFDFFGEPGVIGLPIFASAFLINGFADSSHPQLGPPIDLAYPAQCTGVQPGVNDGNYTQAFTVDATKPFGFAVSRALEIDLIPHQVTVLGPGGPNNAVEFHPCFSFDFYGVTYDSFFVNSNGNVTFGGNDFDTSPTIAEFTNGLPRIAPCWTNLYPNIQGDIYIAETSDRVTITWEDVVALPGLNNRNTFTLDLHRDGTIAMDWLMLAPTGGFDIVGISPGSSAPGASLDLSLTAPFTSPAASPVFQFATETGCEDTIRDLAGGGLVMAPEGAAYAFTPSDFPISIETVTPFQIPMTGGITAFVYGLNFDSNQTYGVEFGAGNHATNVQVIDACRLSCTVPTTSQSGLASVIVSENGQPVDSLHNGVVYVP